MTISKPYRRVIRPFKNSQGRNDIYTNTISQSYFTDLEYASDRISLIRSFNLLEKDLIRLFDYIEPSDQNNTVFSHRLYELFLRASTEFETNCKSILMDNNYRSSGNLNILDYYKINQSSRLSEYEVNVSIWNEANKKVKPFEQWRSTHTLPWYRDYNNVKHNRSEFFELANLENVILAVSGVFIILFSQFYILSFQSNVEVYSVGDCNGWLSHENSIFSIKMPMSWTESDYYEFDWEALKNDADRYELFNFI